MTKNGWREEILNLRSKINIYESSISKYKKTGIRMEDGYIYNGPYMIGCDHGGFHGENRHGVGAGIGECACCPDIRPLRRNELFNLCTGLIESSDAVFCYIDEDDAYGTLFELGYAHAKNIPTFIYLSKDLDKNKRDDLWFSTTKATRVKVVENAKEGFEDFKIVFEKCKKTGMLKEYEFETIDAITPKQLRYLMRMASRLEKFLHYLTDAPQEEKSSFTVSYKSYTVGHFSKELASSCIGLLKQIDDAVISIRLDYTTTPEEWVKKLTPEQFESLLGETTRENLKYLQLSIKELEEYDIDAIFDKFKIVNKNCKMKKAKQEASKKAGTPNKKLDNRVKKRKYSAKDKKPFDYVSNSADFLRTIGEFVTYQVVKPNGKLQSVMKLNQYDRNVLAFRYLESGHFNKEVLEEVMDEVVFKKELAQYIDQLIPKSYAKHLLSLKESPSSYEVKASEFGLIYQFQQ